MTQVFITFASLTKYSQPMTACIVAIFILGLLLIATERIHYINKAAVAMFMGVVCWVFYVCHGSGFVLAEHGMDFAAFLHGRTMTSGAVKEFIAQHLFIKYTLDAAGVVLFLLATTSIVEVLDNNGCFDFLHEAIRTRRPRRFMWTTALITFVLSANLDNLTTVCLMLALMRTLVADERLRRAFGATIIIAAQGGGAFTAIGDVTSLTLWNEGLITPTTYSAWLFLPCLTAVGVSLLLVHRKLPHNMRLVRTLPPYRGDDTILNRWQRLLMLLVGIGGLWFIPTFHRLTHLPSFVGALCVLSVLWIVNELCNRLLMTSDMMVGKRKPMALQYQNVQHMLFFIGLTFAIGAVNETGILPNFCRWTLEHVHNIYILGAASAFVAAFFNNVATLLSCMVTFGNATGDAAFAADGLFWPFLSYCTAMGGAMLTTGSLAGYALWRMEGVPYHWYVRHFFPKVLAGFAVGAVVFWVETLL